MGKPAPREPRLTYQVSQNTKQGAGDIIKVWLDFFFNLPMSDRLKWLESELRQAGDKDVAANIAGIVSQMDADGAPAPHRYDARIEALPLR